MTDTPTPEATPTTNPRRDKSSAIELLLRASIFASFAVVAFSMFTMTSAAHYVERFQAIEVSASTPSDFTGVIGRLTDFPVERAAFISGKDVASPLAGLACAKGRNGSFGFWSVDAQTGGGVDLTAMQHLGKDVAARLGAVCEELIDRIPSI